MQLDFGHSLLSCLENIDVMITNFNNHWKVEQLYMHNNKVCIYILRFAVWNTENVVVDQLLTSEIHFYLSDIGAAPIQIR